MTDDHEPFDDRDDVAAVRDLIARAQIWEEPPGRVEDAVVAAVTAEAEASWTDETRTPTATDAAPRASVRRLRPSAPWWLAAAAVVAVFVTGLALLTRSDDAEPDGIAVELTPSDPVADASATARVSSTPAGLRILLDVDGMPAAPPDSFYEAWLSDGRTSVSCGTFHLRDGDEPIALWAGVADPTFDRIAVTLEPLDGDTGSSGDVQLAGRIDFDALDEWD